jgi:hypothetical protein
MRGKYVKYPKGIVNLDNFALAEDMSGQTSGPGVRVYYKTPEGKMKGDSVELCVTSQTDADKLLNDIYEALTSK